MVISLTLAGPDQIRLRERLSRSLGRRQAPRPAGTELLALVTCHRIELVGAAEVNGSRDLARVRRQLALWAAADPELGAAFAEAAVLRTGAAAHRHLFRLAAGLESPVLGDHQIGGQIRRAFGAARSSGVIGSVLHRLAQTALRIARRVRRETALQGSDRSIAAQAVMAAESRLGVTVGGRCLVVGAGEVAEGLAQRLARRTGVDLVILNRTTGQAETLARRTGGRVAAWERLSEEIRAARTIFLATSAPGPIVEASTWLRESPHPGSLVLDLGMPRNAEPGIAAFPGVELLDLAGVEREAGAAGPPAEAVAAADSIVDHELAAFERWIAAAAQRRALAPFRTRVEAVCRREIAFRLGPEAAELLTRRIVAALCRDYLGAVANG